MQLLISIKTFSITALGCLALCQISKNLVDIFTTSLLDSLKPDATGRDGNRQDEARRDVERLRGTVIRRYDATRQSSHVSSQHVSAQTPYRREPTTSQLLSSHGALTPVKSQLTLLPTRLISQCKGSRKRWKLECKSRTKYAFKHSNEGFCDQSNVRSGEHSGE